MRFSGAAANTGVEFATQPVAPVPESIQGQIEIFRDRHGVLPKTFLLQNHGMIATGGTANEVESAFKMSVKSARVLLGCLQSGHEIAWLTNEEIDHICTWPDEHARQQAIWNEPVR